MTAIASSPVRRPRSSTASFVIEEAMTTPAADIDAHMGGCRAFADFDDPAFDLIARAQFHNDLLLISAVG